MPDLPKAHSVAHCHAPALTVTLDYDARFLRRKVLTAANGTRFLVDLPQTTSVGIGDGFELDDGRMVGVEPAHEPLLEVTGENLPRLAWHIGNRHTPCQIEEDCLLIQTDHVMRDMLGKLGATVTEVEAPFTPEGGAYGHGRTHGHDHGSSHGPDESHGQSHGHEHAHNDDHTHDD